MKITKQNLTAYFYLVGLSLILVFFLRLGVDCFIQEKELTFTLLFERFMDYLIPSICLLIAGSYYNRKNNRTK